MAIVTRNELSHDIAWLLFIVRRLSEPSHTVCTLETLKMSDDVAPQKHYHFRSYDSNLINHIHVSHSSLTEEIVLSLSED